MSRLKGWGEALSWIATPSQSNGELKGVEVMSCCLAKAFKQSVERKT